MDAQLKRGFLDICVLAAIARKDSYGYQIIRDAPASLELSESTLYPILKRLTKQHFLSEYTREHNGRLRKYYLITDAGHLELSRFIADEASITDILSYIKEGASS